jgi:hypothetical protein
MALPLAISDKLNPMQFARAASSFSGYATIVVSFLLLRHLLPKSRVFPLVAPALLAGSWPLAINTMTGLETVFFGALLTIATFLLLREQDELHYQGSSVLYALAALTRPEAIALFFLTFGTTAWHHRRGGKPAKDYLVKLAAPFAAIVGAHEIFRLAYYGEWVPNTYFAKFGANLPPGMPTRLSYLSDFFTKGLDPLGLTCVFVVFFLLFKKRELRAQIILIGAFFGIVNVAISGADFMIGFRYLVPYIPLIYIAATLGGAAIVRRIRQVSARRPLEIVTFFCALLAAFLGYQYSRDKLQSFEQLRFLVNTDTNTALGKWLAKSLPKDTIIVARDIGEIGFLSDLPIIDMTGLTDRSIARTPGNILDREVNLDEVFQKNPGAFVFIAKTPGPVSGARRATAYSSTRSTLAFLDDPRMREFTFYAQYPAYNRLQKTTDGQWQPVLNDAVHPGDFPNSYFLEVYLRNDLANSMRK